MSKKYSLADLAQLTKAKLIGDPNYLVSNVDGLDSAGENDASFLANPRYNEMMKRSHAGVICIDEKTAIIEGKNFLVSDNPSKTFQLIAETFMKDILCLTGFSGIHPSAVIHESVQLGQDIMIGPNVTVDQDVIIGDRTRIFAGCSIGAGVKIGEDSTLYPNVVVREGCEIGSRVSLQPGVVIGSCGFGYVTDNKGQHHKLDQIGNVIIEDDVEIGANTTIDRARFKSTRIGKGTKIDNLVQIAHNVTTDENNIIVSQTGIAGSVKMGKNVFLGGQVGIIGHVEITDNVMIATRGGVSKSITQPGVYGGGPVMPMADFNRYQVHSRKLGRYVKKIEELEKKLQTLEEKE